MSSIWVALGGAIGSLGRFWLSTWFATWSNDPFPWATVLTNISGCFVIGFVAALTGPDGRALASPAMRELIMIGICGGYTTFSAFSLQTLALAQSGDWLRAGANVVASLVFCMLAVWLGHLAGRGLTA